MSEKKILDPQDEKEIFKVIGDHTARINILEKAKERYDNHETRITLVENVVTTMQGDIRENRKDSKAIRGILEQNQKDKIIDVKARGWENFRMLLYIFALFVGVMTGGVLWTGGSVKASATEIKEQIKSNKDKIDSVTEKIDSVNLYLIKQKLNESTEKKIFLKGTSD